MNRRLTAMSQILFLYPDGPYTLRMLRNILLHNRTRPTMSQMISNNCQNTL